MGENQNLIINGSGSYGGGYFHKIKIRGEGTITSDIECKEFKTYGTSDILKNGVTKKFHVFGESDVHGNLETEEMKILGTSAIGGNALCKKAKVWGTLDVGNQFSGEIADIKGNLTVRGDAEFETFHSTGSFEIKGLLNAGVININPRYGMSSADEIGGEKIIVKNKTLLPFFHGDGSVEAHLIEGDEIFLENTRADIVRGVRVSIGSGCEIDVVEYREECNVNINARVKEQRKMD